MKILLAEDDKFFQEFYSFKLREKGVEVTVVGDGALALQHLSQGLPDILLLDLIMPNKDGFEVLQYLHDHNLTGTLPVLVFSTLGQQKDVEKAQLLGARGYVNKSFYDFDKLFARIQELSTQK